MYRTIRIYFLYYIIKFKSINDKKKAIYHAVQSIKESQVTAVKLQ